MPVTNYLLCLHRHQFLSARSSQPPRFACCQKQKHSRIWLQRCRSILQCKKPLSTLKHSTVKKKKKNDIAIISIQSDFHMTVKLFRINASKTTNGLEVNNMIGFANGGERVRFLVGLANTPQKYELLSSLTPIAFWEY